MDKTKIKCPNCGSTSFHVHDFRNLPNMQEYGVFLDCAKCGDRQGKIQGLLKGGVNS